MFILEDLKSKKDMQGKRLLSLLTFWHIIHLSFSQVGPSHPLILYVVLQNMHIFFFS